jgi:hypothetical protein
MCVCVYVCVCMCVCVCVACEWHVKVSYVCVSVCHMCLSVCERDPWREKACVLAFLVCLCYVVCVYAMTGECMYVCVCVCVCVCCGVSGLVSACSSSYLSWLLGLDTQSLVSSLDVVS